MKTIKLATRLNDEALNKLRVTHRDIAFSTCSEIKDGEAVGLTKFFYCREAVVGYFARFFNKLFDDKYLETELMYDKNSSKKDYALYKHKDAPEKKTSVAVHANIGEETREYINSLDGFVKRSVKLLNHYERRNKWFLSQVYKAEHDASKTDLIYLFKSSKWWMTSTHTYSLYLLLIRLGKYKYFDKIEKSTPNSEVLSLLSRINADQKDGRYVSEGQPKMWNILLDNKKEIYGEGPQEENFSSSTRLNTKIDGITNLCSNYACNEGVRKRFAEFCKSAGLKLLT